MKSGVKTKIPHKSGQWARALGALIVILAITWGLGATAATLRSGSTSPQIGDGSSTGTLLSGSYDISEDTGTGDNIIRLINPAGCGNGGVSNQQCGSETDLCAFFYVFDDDQEMGECCGCGITPNELYTASVKNDLTADWGLGVNDAQSGVVQIISGQQNNFDHCDSAHGCNGACDPTIPSLPSTSMIGSISKGQQILGTNGITEIPLQNDGPAETVESEYLSAECASLIANDSGGGVCTCHRQPSPTPVTTPTATPTPSPTPTPTATPAALAVGEANANNTDTGDTQITVGLGRLPNLNQLIFVAIDVIQAPGGPGLSSLTVTPPATTPGHPAWNLIISTPTGSGAPSNPDMVQFLYWHMLGSGEEPASFSFSFGANTYRATAVFIEYQNTCTEDSPTVCPTNGGNPILAQNAGTSLGSNSVSSGAAISVPQNGIAVVAFGTTNTLTSFGQSGSPSGTVLPPLVSEGSNSGINAGLAVYDKFEPNAGIDGPFTATLPNNITSDNVAQTFSIIPK